MSQSTIFSHHMIYSLIVFNLVSCRYHVWKKDRPSSSSVENLNSLIIFCADQPILCQNLSETPKSGFHTLYITHIITLHTLYITHIITLHTLYITHIITFHTYSKLSSSGSLFFRSGFQIIAHSKLGFDLTIKKYNPSSK